MRKNPIAVYLALALAGLTSAQGSIVDVTSPTTSWRGITYTNAQSDASADQQTGIKSGDIVGNANTVAAYVAFGDAGTASKTDGTMGFRIRMGNDQGPTGSTQTAMFGIDGNSDGKIDLFAMVNNSGNPDQIGLYAAGPGLNTAPSNTTVSASPITYNGQTFSYTETSTNYNYQAVTSTNDPGVVQTDLGVAGKADQFLSWTIPLADLISAFASLGITGINEDSALNYVIGTSTQGNSFNQDLAGINGGTNSATSFATLGIIANPVTAGGLTPTPEIGQLAPGIVGVACAIGFGARRRRRKAKDAGA